MWDKNYIFTFIVFGISFSAIGFIRSFKNSLFHSVGYLFMINYENSGITHALAMG